VGEAAGASAPALAVAGWAIGALTGVASWVAGLPGALVLVPSAPPAALAVSFLGLLFVCLWRGPLRWLGLPAAFAVLLWPRPEPPGVWIADGGANAAVVQDGAAHLMLPEVRLFAVELWSRRRGLVLAEKSAFVCGRQSCRSAPDAPGPTVALWRWRKPPSARRRRRCAKASTC
jgi:competence protein ComEC